MSVLETVANLPDYMAPEIRPDYIGESALCYHLFDPRQQIRHSEWF